METIKIALYGRYLIPAILEIYQHHGIEDNCQAWIYDDIDRVRPHLQGWLDAIYTEMIYRMAENADSDWRKVLEKLVKEVS